MASSLKHRRYGLSRLSNSETRHINRALSLASLGTMRHKHGAVVVSGGRVISVGINTYRNDPAIVNDDSAMSPKDISVHAEFAAIKSYGLGYDFKGMSMYVARINSTGNPMLSRPCRECWNLLGRMGFKEVIYT